MYNTKRQTCTDNVTMRRTCATNVAVHSSIYWISRTCVRILVSAMRHAKRILGAPYYITLPSTACPAPPLFFPLLPWKINKYYIFRVCVCSLSYPTRQAHAPYYIASWPVRLPYSPKLSQNVQF
jgi:hypothetical protein